MTTKPLRYTGQQLLLNYVVKPGGALMVEVLNEAGEVIGKSGTLSGDAVDAKVKWVQKPGLGQGTVQLRFTIRNADVYSMQFK